MIHSNGATCQPLAKRSGLLQKSKEAIVRFSQKSMLPVESFRLSPSVTTAAATTTTTATTLLMYRRHSRFAKPNPQTSQCGTAMHVSSGNLSFSCFNKTKWSFCCFPCLLFFLKNDMILSLPPDETRQ